ncbi:hypothetical protein PORCRE_1102 [Porphyromonas crevioricanis JCM 15906]|uniref:Uncharacterized protein n=1 Tax=Porphyromonas crevioricanis JCM 15906 TaxID=1305617 RepID=T1CHK1_9PORP|nr:hypothetical protein PORCRE_1102 [Porphyromonas crevioricanis JCM 15906]
MLTREKKFALTGENFALSRVSKKCLLSGSKKRENTSQTALDLRTKNTSKTKYKNI